MDKIYRIIGECTRDPQLALSYLNLSSARNSENPDLRQPILFRPPLVVNVEGGLCSITRGVHKQNTGRGQYDHWFTFRDHVRKLVTQVSRDKRPYLFLNAWSKG